MSSNEQKKKWTKQNSMKTSGGNSIPPSYPNEVMIKVFASSFYSDNFQPVRNGQKVLDVGCGFGNNLTFFLDRGCDVTGVDVTEDMVEQATDNLNRLGYGNADIKIGENIKLPFDDNTFDTLISVAALHYSQGEQEIEKSLSEFSRVVADDGRVFILTAGPEHNIVKNSKRHKIFEWEVLDFGFRTGDRLSFFDDIDHFKNTLSERFHGVEVGRLTEKYATVTLDFLFAICTNKK